MTVKFGRLSLMQVKKMYRIGCTSQQIADCAGLSHWSLKLFRAKYHIKLKVGGARVGAGRPRLRAERVDW